MGTEGMSIGLGIFLASVYLGTVYLYVQTRDRWNWSKLAARTAFVAAGAVIGAVLIYSAKIGYEKWEARPRILTGIGPVAVGEPWSDVLFKAGKFELTKAPAARKGEERETYRHDTLPLTVHVEHGTVHYIVYDCQKDPGLFGAFNGIRCGDDGSTVLAMFGPKVRVLCQKVPSSFNLRVYDVVDYGTRYVMEANKVSAVGVANPANLAHFFGITWDKCGLAPLEITAPEQAKKGEGPNVLPASGTPAPGKI